LNITGPVTVNLVLVLRVVDKGVIEKPGGAARERGEAGAGPVTVRKMGPVVAPAGTVVVIVVSLFTVKTAA
jgi:hypothetical protein